MYFPKETLLRSVEYEISLIKTNYFDIINQFSAFFPLPFWRKMFIRKADTSNAPFVAPLDYFRRNDLNFAGGKGANLGELSKAGFAVPAGFIITTAAYDHLLNKDDAQSRLDQLLSACDFENPDTVAATSQEIHDLFQKIAIPEQLRKEILRSYQVLEESALAVRSSATSEDLPEAAFAGQQETFLNIVGEENLMEAVRACWASLWSERAILYRRRQGIDQTTVKLAVVVQKMIQADVAGVMFTANPVSGQRDELSIDANPGLGEAVVGGLVTPDHFVVVRVHNIVNDFISKKVQDIVNCCSLLTYRSGLHHAFCESERAWTRNKSIDCAGRRSACACRVARNKRFWQEFSVVAPG